MVSASTTIFFEFFVLCKVLDIMKPPKGLFNLSSVLYNRIITTGPLMKSEFCLRNLKTCRGILGTTSLKNNIAVVPLTRLKSTSKSRNNPRSINRDDDEDVDSDNDEDDENEEDSPELRKRGVEVKTYVLQNLRVDHLIKLVMNYRRVTVEDLFYERKIYVNQKLLLKKALKVNVEDEVDVIRGSSKDNPDYLTVARLEILNISNNDEDEEQSSVLVKIRRTKSMLVEDYTKSRI